MNRALVSLTAAALLLPSAVAAQEESSAAITNPFNSADDLADGQRRYMSQCAGCHGRDGRGGQGTPDFTTGNFRRASSDEGLFQVVAKGIPGTTMPAFSLSGRQIWQTLAYIRSLGASRTAEHASGDVARGAMLFKENRCGGCHSSTAPDLREIGRERSLAELKRSILDPQAEVSNAYWRIKATTRDGAAVEGLRLNEDTHSVQYLDRQGKLRSARKEALAGYEIVKQSPMPAYRGKLTGAQVNDLVAYLVKGGSR
ncbi:MAG: c-type cytochrome [Bryobacteraceae bacterium]